MDRSIFIDLLFFYLTPSVLIWGIYLTFRVLNSKESEEISRNAIDSGMTEPASLHPVVDHNVCLGCGSCIDACPEQGSHKVLGLINNKSHLISPTYCIGHGSCKDACPHGGITLVFGTEKRGVDIPTVSSSFESNIKGVFIAGELGGMGLIRNAIIQGREALEYIIQMYSSAGDTSQLDVVILGAGPAGFSASLAALKNNIRYVTLEQESLGGTVFHYPRGKIVMTAPVELPIIGKMMFKETTKEELLEFWQEAERKSGVKINYKERVEKIIKRDDGFEVKTTRGTYLTRTVLLSIGRRGTPRRLGVPGEDKAKVVYSLIDPEQYRGQHVLVVGGGDSALEAAASIASEPGTTVTLSYRSAAFSRAKEKNRLNVDKAEKEGRLNILMSSNVKCITDNDVQIMHEGKVKTIKNDVVIVNAGGILPTAFLKDIGIEVETKYGTA